MTLLHNCDLLITIAYCKHLINLTELMASLWQADQWGTSIHICLYFFLSFFLPLNCIFNVMY